MESDMNWNKLFSTILRFILNFCSFTRKSGLLARNSVFSSLHLKNGRWLSIIYSLSILVMFYLVREVFRVRSPTVMFFFKSCYVVVLGLSNCCRYS